MSLVVDKTTGEELVMKRIGLAGVGDDVRVRAEQEVAVLAGLDHPNVVRFRTSFLRDDECCIVMEKCEENLESVIDVYRQANEALPAPVVVEWMAELLSAVTFVHSRSILHRDIKSSNIFLSLKNHVKLGDFGVCKVLTPERMATDSLIGTPYYVAPELWEGIPYDEKCDVWSLGVVFYELCAMQLPFKADNLLAVVREITSGEPPPLPKHLDKRFATIISQMLHKDPSKRPTAKQILETQMILPASHPSHPGITPSRSRAIQAQQGPTLTLIQRGEGASTGANKGKLPGKQRQFSGKSRVASSTAVVAAAADVFGTPPRQAHPVAGGSAAKRIVPSPDPSLHSAGPSPCDSSAADVQPRRTVGSATKNASSMPKAATPPAAQTTRNAKQSPVSPPAQPPPLSSSATVGSPEAHHASLQRIRNAKSKVNVAELRRRLGNGADGSHSVSSQELQIFLPMSISPPQQQRTRDNELDSRPLVAVAKGGTPSSSSVDVIVEDVTTTGGGATDPCRALVQLMQGWPRPLSIDELDRMAVALNSYKVARYGNI